MLMSNFLEFIFGGAFQTIDLSSITIIVQTQKTVDSSALSSALCRQQIARFWNRDRFDTGLLLQEAESKFTAFHFLSATCVWQMPDTEIQESRFAVCINQVSLMQSRHSSLTFLLMCIERHSMTQANLINII